MAQALGACAINQRKLTVRTEKTRLVGGMEEMSMKLSKPELYLCCSTTINDGKCQNESCEKFSSKPNDYEVEICYFIPLKDQLQRILAGKPMSLEVYCVDNNQNQCLDFLLLRLF